MVALGNPSDGNHSKARRQLTEMPEVRFVTSDYILDEALTAWMRLGKTRAGLDYVARLLTSPRVALQIVDRPFFDAARERRPKEITNFIFIGRIILNKGFADVIEALGRLAKKGFKNWTLRIVGEGRAEWARKAASENGIADKVTVCDAVDDQGLYRELEQVTSRVPTPIPGAPPPGSLVGSPRRQPIPGGPTSTPASPPQPTRTTGDLAPRPTTTRISCSPATRVGPR